MSTIFPRRLLMALLVSLAFAAFPAFTYANHSWNGYHWARTSNPFTLNLGDNVSSAWDEYLANTRTDWVIPNLLYPEIVTGLASSNLRKCPPTSGRVEVCSYKYGTNGWLGVAQIWVSGKHITQGTVKMNDSYFDNSRYPKYNSAPWRNMVMCQEVGHTFGLDHQDETFNNYNLGSCMDYTNYPEGGVQGSPPIDYGPSNQEPGGSNPGDSDYDELRIIYAHGDSTTTFGQTLQTGRGKGKTPPAANDEPVELGTAQWGKLIRSTNNGRTELYELDLGGGHKVLTHVIWADPEEEPGPQRGRR
jgi:hypothetical protein